MATRRGGDTEVAAFLSLLEQRAPRPLTITEMARLLKQEHYDRRQLQSGLEEAVAKHQLRRLGKTRYQWVRPDGRRSERPRRAEGRRPSRQRAARENVEGRYSRVRAGYGFVEVLGRGAERF